MPDRQYNLLSKKHIPIKHPQDVKGVICSFCFQIILASTQEQIKRAYQKALNAGLIDKAKALETFLEEEITEYGETKKPSRNLGRIRALRKAGLAGHKVRPKRTVRQLDKGRVAVC